MQHRLEQERLRRRKRLRVSVRLVEKVAQKIGLETIKQMSYQEFEEWCKRHRL